MIRTKLAKKVLTKAEQKHLTESGVHSMEAFKRTRAAQIKMKEDEPRIEPCFECRHIAQKLGIE
jgi:hypothetical protein